MGFSCLRGLDVVEWFVCMVVACFTWFVVGFGLVVWFDLKWVYWLSVVYFDSMLIVLIYGLWVLCCSGLFADGFWCDGLFGLVWF